MKAVILAAGRGTRLWPYSTTRNKCLLPVSNRPIAAHLVDAIIAAGVSEILVVTGESAAEFSALFYDMPNVQIIRCQQTEGAAQTLLCARPYVEGEFAVFYGDTILSRRDAAGFLRNTVGASVLVSKAGTPAVRHENVSCTLQDGLLTRLRIASRSEDDRYIVHAYRFSPDVFDEIERTPAYFDDLNVGVMPSRETYLASVINQRLHRGERPIAYIAQDSVFDINKPWDLLRANHAVNQWRTDSLVESVWDEGSSVSSSARIHGSVQLGKNSRIGDGVLIEGNCIIGDNTIIENGAVIGGGTVIGNGVQIRDYCIVQSGSKGNSTIGNQCILGHCSEIYNSLLMERVSMAHFGEFSGVIGRNTDIGAGTLIGSLRFDDGRTSHIIRGRREIPDQFANAVYIGDYNRTGVGAILMPGVHTGAYCITGSGVLLQNDLPDRKLIMVKQETTLLEFGPEKYGL